MPKLYYQGHGSYRITANNGQVIYIDPFVGDGYEKPADIILITHAHKDHNKISLCTQTPNCRVITNEEAIINGVHQTFTVGDITIEAVEAKNFMHNPQKCVGYVIVVDGVTVYASGDTSKTQQMEKLTEKEIDYAIFCCDGIFNMGLQEATECAKIVGAKHNIPVHTSPWFVTIFSEKRANEWDAPNKLIVKPKEEIELQHI